MVDLVGQAVGSIPSVSIQWEWVVVIFFGMLSILAVWYFGRQHLYPILIIIRKKVGTGEVIVFDHGSPVVKDGIKMLHVFNAKTYNPWPKTDQLSPYRGLFKKWCIEMYQDSNGTLSEGLVVVKTDTKGYEATFVPDDKAKQAWAMQQRKRNREEYMADFWSKYGVLVGESILVLALIVMGMVIMNKHVEAAEIMARAINEAATVRQALGG